MKKLLGFGAVALALAGCGGGKVTISSRVGTRTPTALTAASQGSQLTLAGGDVTIDDVKIIVRRIRLEPTVAPTGESSAGEDELGIGPFPLEFTAADLAGGTLVHEFTANVDGGTYKQIKFEIHKVEDADVQAASAADAALLTEMKGLSVKIHGFYLSKEFTFTSALDEEQEREGTFNVGGDSGLTLNIDPTGWFADPSNAAVTLDPGDSANKSKIESNIKASIDVYDDDDHDGKPDPS